MEIGIKVEFKNDPCTRLLHETMPDLYPAPGTVGTVVGLWDGCPEVFVQWDKPCSCGCDDARDFSGDGVTRSVNPHRIKSWKPKPAVTKSPATRKSLPDPLSLLSLEELTQLQNLVEQLKKEGKLK